MYSLVFCNKHTFFVFFSPQSGSIQTIEQAKISHETSSKNTRYSTKNIESADFCARTESHSSELEHENDHRSDKEEALFYSSSSGGVSEESEREETHIGEVVKNGTPKGLTRPASHQLIELSEFLEIFLNEAYLVGKLLSPVENH